MTVGDVIAGRQLAALETIEQVFAWLVRSERDALVVALSAEADEALDFHGVVHATIEDFYDEAELMRGADANNAVTEAICAALDRLLGIRIGNHLPEFSAFYHRGRIRILYDALQRAAFCLGAMLDAVKPSKVIVGAASAPEASEIWVRDRSFLSFALASVASGRGLPLDVLPPAVASSAKSLPLQAAARERVRNLRDRLRSFVPGSGDVGFFYWPDMPKAELARAGVRAIRMPAARPSSQYDLTPGIDSLSPMFMFGRDSLFDLARPHLATFVGPFRATSVAHLRIVERVFGRSGARVGVAAAALNIEAINTLLAARRAGAPAVVLQHGGFNGYADFTILPFSEFGLNDRYLCYGEGVAAGVSREANEISVIRGRAVQVAIIGSSAVQDIFRSRTLRRPDGGRPRGLYVSGILTGSSRYLAGHVRADISYWRQQRSVLSLLMSRTDWNIEFRPPPENFVGNPVLRWLERQIGHNIRVRTDRSLRDLLRDERYDLIITDAVATVLLEALATDAAVVVQFDGVTMRLRPTAQGLLEKRASVSFSESEFLSDIKRALDERGARPVPNDTFLRHYALPGRGDTREAQAVAMRAIVASASAIQ